MSHLAKALPDLVSAGLLFAVWSEPGRFGAEWFRAGAVGLTLTYDMPELGASAEVRAATGFDKGGGVWETEPHRALAGGVLYFAVMGLLRPQLAWAFASR